MGKYSTINVLGAFACKNILHASLASRMMIGPNWFLGYSHQTKAKDRQFNEMMTTEWIADSLEGA